MTAIRRFKGGLIVTLLVSGIACAIWAGPRALQEPLPTTDLNGELLPAGAVARLGARRFRLEDPAEALIYTPDGKTLVGYTKSGVFLWEAATGHERQRLPVTMPFGASGMDVAPDSATLAVADYNSERDEAKVSLWNLRSGQKTGTLSLPKGEGALAQLNHLSFSPDGKSVALSRTNKGNALVFNVASGEVRASLAGVNSVVYHLAFSPDSKTLALAVESKHAIQLWDIATGKMIRTILDLPKMSQHSKVGALAFAPNGKMLACGIMDRIYLNDPATGKKLGQLESAKLRGITRLAFSPDGEKLVAGSLFDSIAETWDVATSQIVHTFDGGVFMGRSLALSLPANTVALGTSYGQVRTWDMTTGKDLVAERQNSDAPIHCLAFSPDGKALASATDSGQVSLWDMATKRRSVIVPGIARSVLFSPGGRLLALVAGDKSASSGKVRLWDMAASKDTLTLVLPRGHDIQSAVFSPDGRKLFTLSGRQIGAWDLATGKQSKQWTIPPKQGGDARDGPADLERRDSQFSSLVSDGKTVFEVQDNRDIGVYIVHSPRGRLLRGPPDDAILSLAASPDGRVLATGLWGLSPGIRLWEVVTGKQICRLEGHQGGVAALAWSHDGRVVASGEQHSDALALTLSQTVRLWDSATGKELARFGGFNADVSALAFSQDGTALAAGLRDGTMLIWDLRKAGPKSVPPTKLTETELLSHWIELADADAGKAHLSIARLIAGAQDSVPFLRRHLKPVDGVKIQQWIADLNSANYAARQAAGKQLARAGEEAKGPMQMALTGDLPLETHRRLVLILASLPDVPSGPGTVRTIRAIMALERIGSPSAQGVLRNLAAGAPGARATEEAKASLQRLANRK